MVILSRCKSKVKVISLLVVSFSGFLADFVFEMSWALVILAYVNIAVRACYFALINK